MRRRIETGILKRRDNPPPGLPTNIHEKKDWNWPGNIPPGSHTPLTNQYPWEEGLKPNQSLNTKKNHDNLPTNIHEKKDWNRIAQKLPKKKLPLTNQYPWEEGLKLGNGRAHVEWRPSYQPISMRRRIETEYDGFCVFPLLLLPTNIHEKKDWNTFAAMTKYSWRTLTNQYPWEEGLKHTPHPTKKPTVVLTNQYPWEEGLKPQTSRPPCCYHNSYQPISMRRRIETMVVAPGAAVYPPAYQPISMRRRIETFKLISLVVPLCVLPTNIHEKKDWNSKGPWRSQGL